jgi:hypothetical protein
VFDARISDINLPSTSSRYGSTALPSATAPSTGARFGPRMMAYILRQIVYPPGRRSDHLIAMTPAAAWRTIAQDFGIGWAIVLDGGLEHERQSGNRDRVD